MQTKEKRKFIKGKNDRMFKTIVANEEDSRFLEAILEACLKEQINIQNFYLTELPVSSAKERVKTVDVLISTKEKYIHLEANSKFDTSIRTRNLNFFTAIYHQRTKRGKEYDTKTKMVHVDINFSESAKDLDRRTFALRSKEDKKLGEKNELVKEYGEKVMELNKTDPFIFEVTAEEDREMIFNTRLRLATEEAAEKAAKKASKRATEKAKSQAANQVEKTIQKMLLKGMSNEDIQDITEYKVEKIKAIREKLENSQKLS